MANTSSWFYQNHMEERRLQVAKTAYMESHRIPETFSARNPAYKGTVLQAKHGGAQDAVR